MPVMFLSCLTVRLGVKATARPPAAPGATLDQNADRQAANSVEIDEHRRSEPDLILAVHELELLLTLAVGCTPAVWAGPGEGGSSSFVPLSHVL